MSLCASVHFWLFRFDLTDTNTPYLGTTSSSERQIGSAVGWGNIVLGNAHKDIIVGERWRQGFRFAEADTWPSGLTEIRKATSNGNYGWMGDCVLTGVDFDGDGIEDVAVGGPRDHRDGASPDPDLAYAGSVIIVRGNCLTLWK